MFFVVGETLVDLVGQRGERTLEAHPGGSPANVALGLARLGHPVTLKTRVGRDAFGEMVTAHLEAGGVRVDRGPSDGVATSLTVTCSRPGADPPTREEADSARTARPRVGPLAPAGPEEWG